MKIANNSFFSLVVLIIVFWMASYVVVRCSCWWTVFSFTSSDFTSDNVKCTTRDVTVSKLLSRESYYFGRLLAPRRARGQGHVLGTRRAIEGVSFLPNTTMIVKLMFITIQMENALVQLKQERLWLWSPTLHLSWFWVLEAVLWWLWNQQWYWILPLLWIETL